MPPAVVSVSHGALVWVADHTAEPDPSPMRVTAVESDDTIVAPSIVVSARVWGLTLSMSASATTIVSLMLAGLPIAPTAVTVSIATNFPNGSPVGSRVHRTMPLPVPLAVVNVTQVIDAFLDAVHAAVLDPNPVSVTETESGNGTVDPPVVVSDSVVGSRVSTSA